MNNNNEFTTSSTLNIQPSCKINLLANVPPPPTEPANNKTLLSDNATYEGNYKNNLFEGYGIYKSQKYNYFGNYHEGKKYGKGKLVDFEKNTEYEGLFENDQKNGKGVEKYNDILYEGEFKNNLKEGKGKLIVNSNNRENYIYIGDFHDDKISGKGKAKWKNERAYEGEWKNNEMNGYGMLIDNKIRYIGYFKNNLKDGYGANLFEDESYVLLGKWENDYTEGFCIFIPFDEYDEKEENFVYMSRGNAMDIELTQNEINNFKFGGDYETLKSLYRNKFYPDFLKYVGDV